MDSPRRKSASRSKLTLFIGLILIGAVVYLLQNKSTAASSGLNPNDIPQTVSTADEFWAANDFAFRRKLNTDGNHFYSYSFDHAALVNQHQSLADGTDLKVIAQMDKAAEIMATDLTGVNTASTVIKFDASKYPTAHYYLYFGNTQPEASKVLGTTSTTAADLKSISGQATQLPTLAVSGQRYWQLSYKSGTDIKLNFVAATPLDPEKYMLFYALDGSEDLQAVPAGSVSGGTVNLHLGNISVGTHSVYFVASQEGQAYRSANVKFKVSKPVYVAWTVDWEGYDVKDSVLESFTNISSKYNVAMTQFFNPRIYIDTTIPVYRRNQLTNWVKTRAAQRHDEIAMHMHMQYDLVRAAGVSPITSPRWGTGKDGYDVLTLDYNYDQFSQILKWGLQTFADQGLPVPKGFRAGGWFASLDTLRAESALGFVYDSSGRETYTFGIKNAKGPWTLDHTTQPYKPSKSNQNSSEPPPTLDLWEMPNNGNDSYWFSTQELIDRFYVNYTTPGKESSAPKLITYLSHPDWFYVDQPKIEALFAEVSKYSYDSDHGPVVFATLSDALTQWQ